MPILTNTKIRAIRAFIGIALSNLKTLSREDREAAGISAPVQEAELLLTHCHSELTDMLKSEAV